MLRFVKTWSGTLIPLVLLGSFALAYLDAYINHLTWERPTAYLWGAVWHSCGLYVLLIICIHAMREAGKAPLLLLSFTYQKFFFDLTYLGLAIFAAGLVWPGTFGWFSEDLVFALFIATTMASSVVNAVLLFGWWRGWLEEDADPLPFRPLWRWVARRRRNP